MDLTDAAIRDLAVRVSGDPVVFVRNDSFMPVSLVYAMGTPRTDFPGIGAYAVQAITDNDLPKVLGVTMVAALFIVVCNLVVDLLYAAIDPRVRFS